VGKHLTVFCADLNADAGWAEAVGGCDYVLHVASPYPSTVPKDENELIAPARDGALRVLRAARDAGVRRVVLTSSFAAIGFQNQLWRDDFLPFCRSRFPPPSNKGESAGRGGRASSLRLAHKSELS
jgi:nucleoside-diphosphate-sugar epimerase